MLRSVAILSACLLAATCSPQGTAWWRFPYANSPHVIVSNPRDGLPDFDYFDAENASLTAATIQCPPELTMQCSADGGKASDEGCGSKGLKKCLGGVYCAGVAHAVLRKLNVTAEYFPNYAGHEALVRNRTRRNILQRAVGWLSVHAPYFGCTVPKTKYGGTEMCATDDAPECPQYTYTLTCEGLISMAWGSPGYGGGKPKPVTISHLDLQPGDAMPVVKSVDGKVKGTSHFLMFREWADEDKKTARVYQMGGEHGTTNMKMVVSPKWCKDDLALQDDSWVEESLHLEMKSAEMATEAQLAGTKYCLGARRYGALVAEE